MKRTSCKNLLLLTAAGMLLLLPGCALAQTADEEGARQTLEGSWMVQVTQVNCQTGAALGAPFLSLLTFARGGTMVETTSNPMFYPAVRGPGHGVWKRDRHGYRAVSTAFITLNGELVRTQSISQTIEIGRDPNSFTTPSASVVFVPVGGGPTVTGCATAAGKRIVLPETE
jgi:hypothetical protein